MSRYLGKTQTPTVLIFSNVYEGKHKPEDVEKYSETELRQLKQEVEGELAEEDAMYMPTLMGLNNARVDEANGKAISKPDVNVSKTF